MTADLSLKFLFIVNKLHIKKCNKSTLFDVIFQGHKVSLEVRNSSMVINEKDLLIPA